MKELLYTLVAQFLNFLSKPFYICIVKMQNFFSGDPLEGVKIF